MLQKNSTTVSNKKTEALRFEHVNKQFPNASYKALDDITLSIDEGEITNVAVSPEMRCHGIGGMLLAEAKKEAESRSVGRIVLEVRCSNDSAIRLYERNGFVNHGVRKGFYELPKEDAYIMIYGQ